jgi:hypothetical protein
LFRGNVRGIIAAPGGREGMERTLDANVAIATMEGRPPRPQVIDPMRKRLTDPTRMRQGVALGRSPLIDHAMTASREPFTTDQKTAVSGYSHFDYCTNNKLRYAAVAADINCDPGTVPPVVPFLRASRNVHRQRRVALPC